MLNKRRLKVFGLWLGLLCVCPVWAWNAAGHRLVAAIAWSELTPSARLAVKACLERHSDFSRWAGRGGDDGSGRQAFIESATWADELRDDPRYVDDEPGAEGALQPPDLLKHRHWHYVDFDAGGVRLGHGSLDRQLPRLLDWLLQGTPDQQVYALPWLIHLVGDAHQPLHVGSRGDEGGNGFRVMDSARPSAIISLHRWWDDLPGPPWLRGERLDREQLRLQSVGHPPAPGGVAVWLEESRLLAHASAYPPAQGEMPVVLDQGFRSRAQAFAEQRLFAAGVRLAQLLNRAFGHSRESGRQP